MRVLLLLLCLISLGIVTAACDARRGGGGGGFGDDDDAGDDDAGDDDAGDDDDGPAPYGPPNAWFHAGVDALPDPLPDAVRANGSVAPNFTLVDQNGDEVELYQFWGKVVVLDVFAEWCGPCQANAPEGERLWDEAAGEVVVVAVMQETATAGAPGPADAARWAADYGLSHPVLADPAQTQIPYIVTGFPTYIVLDRDMVIATMDLWPFDVDYVLALAAQG